MALFSRQKGTTWSFPMEDITVILRNCVLALRMYIWCTSENMFICMWFHRKVCQRNLCILSHFEDNVVFRCRFGAGGVNQHSFLEVSGASLYNSDWGSGHVYITGAGWNPFMFQVVLYISTIMQGCLSPSPHKTLKPVACSALSHPFRVQTPLSPTTYKKKLVFGEQKLLLLLGGGFPDLWVILIKPRNVLKAVARETTNYFVVEA